MQLNFFDKTRHIIPISGKDSLATALFQLAKEPSLPYEYLYNPTGAELPEVLVWLKKVEDYLQKPIQYIGKNLYDIIKYERGGFLPSQFNRFCTNQSKIEPTELFIGKSPCYVYYGIRADENRAGYNNAGHTNIKAVFPLAEAGINLPMVYTIIKNAGLKPPVFFWEEIYNRVCNIVGKAIVDSLPEWIFDMLFAWRTRANCYFCFNQRVYEWAGLLVHHPELFWTSEEMEHNGSTYYWQGANKPLTKIADDLEAIITKRVNAVVKKIQQILEKKSIDLSSDDDNKFIDILSVTSCGLYCGK